MSDMFVPTPDDERLAEEERDLYSAGMLILKEAKAGYKTTEFWSMVVGSFLVNLNAIPLPDRYQGWVTAVLVAAYMLSRGLAKAGVPTVDPEKKAT